MFANNGVSLADIAAVTNQNRNNGYGMDGGGWWAWIILLALFGFGDGGFGWGGNNRGTSCQTAQAVEASVQRGFDTSAIITKLDGLNAGICSLGYDQLAQMNGINNAIMQTGFGLQQGLNANNVAAMQNTNALSTQLANCCCENREAIANVRFDMSTLGCSILNRMNENAQAVMQNDNANFRALNDQIRDGFTALAMSQKDQYISQLEQRLNQCDRDAALQAQANYLVGKIAPCPIPAYMTCNPNTGAWFPCGTDLSGYFRGDCCNDRCGRCC